MDYHLLTKKCDGMCDSCECPPAEFECQGEPSLCSNPRGCACFEAGRTDRPSTPVGWSDTDWLKHLEEIRQDQETYHRGPLPETGWD